MTVVSVGQFATMTQLSVKTLRHYHEVRLLEPARVDADTGYRYYDVDQLPAAQLIRRLRNLRMAIPDVRRVLAARDPDERNALIAAHLDRLEAELAETREAVSSLRTLLDTARTRSPVSRRFEPAVDAAAITATVAPGELGGWWTEALRELRSHVANPTGPAGGIFDEAIYRREPGEATVFVPDPSATVVGRIRRLGVPAAELAVTVHRGPTLDIDLAYADLGAWLVERGLEAGGPIRERYVVDHTHTADASRWETEIGWPVRATMDG